jgi:hemerythrin
MNPPEGKMQYEYEEHNSNHKVEHVKWSNTYSLGIKLIDDQHKGLLDLVNELFNHSTGNEVVERAYFKEVIGQAVDYVKVHFATEEKYMLATKFPGYEEHKKAHSDFILAVVKSAKDFDAGKRLVLVNFSKFLRDWVLGHIAVMDVKYSEHFRKIASRKADGKLSINAQDIARILDAN